MARVVADMGLDLWCLARADPSALDAVCERLWAAHGLSYQPVPIGPASSGAVLVRPSRALAVEPVADVTGRPLARTRIRAAVPAG